MVHQLRACINTHMYKHTHTHTPLTPFFSISSMKRDRYSGDLSFRFTKNSKSYIREKAKHLILYNIKKTPRIFITENPSWLVWTHWLDSIFEHLVIGKGPLQEHGVLIIDVQQTLNVGSGIPSRSLWSWFLRDYAPPSLPQMRTHAPDNALQPTLHTTKQFVHARQVYKTHTISMNPTGLIISMKNILLHQHT